MTSHAIIEGIHIKLDLLASLYDKRKKLPKTEREWFEDLVNRIAADVDSIHDALETSLKKASA